MSSNFKKDLKKEATKGAEAEVTSDIVTLPPDADDVVYTVVTDDSVVGEVNAKLEMSYDKENWCPAVREEAGGSGTTTYSFSNQFCVDTTATPSPTGDPPVAAEDVAKNKYAVGQLSHNTSGEDVGVGDAAATRDALHHHMTKGDAFNLSWWHKSDVQPSATITYNYSNKQYFEKGGDEDDYFTTTNLTASGSDQVLRNTKAWTISFWYNTSSLNQGMAWGTGGNKSGIGFGTSNKIFVKSISGTAYHDFIPSADTWYNIVLTNEPVASDGDWWHFDRDDSTGEKGLKLYVNGSAVAWDSGSTQKLDTQFDTSEDFRMFSRGDWKSATGDYDEISIHNTTKSDAEVSSMYNSGTPTDLSSDSSCKVWLRADGMANGDLANGDVITNSISASSSTYVTTCVTDNTGDISVADLGGSESIYIAPTIQSTTNDYNPIIFKHGGHDPYTNKKIIDLIPDGAEKKNKYLSAPANIGSPARDIFHEKMGQDKEFTLNTWFKSSTAPNSTDYLPVLFNNGAKAPATQVYGNEKCLVWDGTFGMDQEHIKVDKIADTDDSDCLITTDKDWTVSFWIKRGSTDPAGKLPFFSTGYSTTVGGLMLYTVGSNLALDIYANSTGSGSYSYITWYASVTDDYYFDGEWHHIALTWKGVDSEGDAWSGKQADPDGSHRGPRLYIDGVYRQAYGLGGFSGSPSYESTNIINSSTADDDFTIGGFPSYGGGTWGDNANGMQMMDFSVHNEYKSSTAAAALYNQGHPLDLKTNDSSTKLWLNFEGSGDISDGDDIPCVIGTYTATAGASGTGDLNYGTLPVISSEYRKSVAADNTFANGLTASFTKKIVTSDTQGNTGYLRLPKEAKDVNNVFKMGAAATWNNDGDNFFFRRETDSYTISWWMRTDYLQSVDSWYYDNHIFSNGTTTQWEGLSISVRGTKLRLGLQGTGSVYAWNNFDASGWDDGDWHHYAVTWNPTGMTDDVASPDFSNLKLYRNGSAVSVDSSDVNGAFLDDNYDTNSTGEVRFGMHPNPYSQHGVVSMDINDVAIWKTDLSATQINTIYNSGQPNDISSIESSSLKRYYKFDRRDGTDETGNHNGTRGSLTSFRLFETGDDTYVAASFANTFDEAAGQATSLLVSLDGFEDGADAWVNYPAASLLDGNWHNLQITWDGSGDGSASKTYDTNLSVYVDGAKLTKNASKNNASTFDAADKHFKYTTGTFVPGTFGASGFAETGGADSKYAFQGALDNVSLHSEKTTDTIAKEFYGTDKTTPGKPSNYKTSAILNTSKVEGWWKFEETASATTAIDSSGNSINLTLNNMDTGDWVALTDSDSIYLDTQVNGEGLTVSITRNLWKNTSTNKVEWVNSQDKDAMLVLSFNGFERDAEYWVAYKCNQTGYSINLLDGHWNNVVISYRGTTFVNAQEGGWTSDKIRFGPNSTSGDPWHINVSYNGTSLEGITPQIAVSDGASGTLTNFKGFDLSKPDADGSDNLSAGFIISDKHLKHVDTTNQTYKPHCWLASGITESAGEDSIYAFQGKIEETSFHSGKNTTAADGDNSWWLTMSSYNSEKPKTIAGTTTASGVISSRHQPYDLLNPSEVFSSGTADITANQYINPLPYNASSNATGGVEVYYRWGDKDGDCSSTIWDARTADDPSTSSQSFNLAVQHFNEGNKTQLDASDTVASNTAKTMKVDAVETTTGGSSGFVNVEHKNLPTEEVACVSSSINVPTLPHFRVKWAGAGTVNLGESKSKATLWYRSKK